MKQIVKRTKRLVCLRINTILVLPILLLLYVPQPSSKVTLSDGVEPAGQLWDQDIGCRSRHEIYYLHQEHSATASRLRTLPATLRLGHPICMLRTYYRRCWPTFLGLFQTLKFSCAAPAASIFMRRLSARSWTSR